ncbi:MAG: hypothetical protein CVV44_00230 [Spirochaetae bacterium HGW-Spirochaetae-1]|jgi:putative GTP pyrophosphokinase|nr:MAG: hypothetical protein CVV44_00230 [Spirochaetae bacterium HGW-Spirochaetae-1]
MNQKSVNYWIDSKSILQKEYGRRHGKLIKALDILIDHIDSQLAESSKTAMIKGRVKDFEAFYRKLLVKSQKQHIENPFEAINDLIGIRIIVPFLEDIQVIEGIMKRCCEVLETKYKHQELSIKEFGYDSTHLIIEFPIEILSKMRMKETLVCEIQLRTILQDAWAEVEHELVYKTNIDKVETTIRRKLVALNATLSLADITFQEIRDYQRKRILELEERHTRLLDKVSTVPEKMGNAYRNPGKDIRNSAGEIIPPIINFDTELNDLVVEALNAHISNNLDKALELYTHLLLISPNHYLFNHRGLVYFSLSQYEMALDDFNKAIEIERGDTRIYTNRGLTHRMLKDYEKALVDFNKSLDLNPLWPDTFYGRALTFYDMGNIQAALEDCDKAIALKPDFKQAVRFKQFLLNQSMG